MRHGVYKNRFFGSVRAIKKSWIPIWIAMVWVAFFGFRATGWGQLTLPQGTSYTETFDSIGTALPTGWAVRTGATSSARGTSQVFTTTAATWSASTGAFKNLASADGGASGDSTTTQSGRTDRTLGIRQTSTFGDPGAAFELELANTTGRSGFALSVKHQMLSVQSYSTTWTVQYSTTGTSWADLGTYIDPGVWGSASSNYNFGSNIDNNSGPVLIRVVALAPASGSSSRDTYGIDDFVLTWSTAPSVTSSAATSIGATAATLNGNVTADGGATITERGFVYKTSPGVAITDNKMVVSGTTGAYTLGLSSLTTGSTYYFKAYAINSSGTTLSSPELSFTTGAVASPTITTATVATVDAPFEVTFADDSAWRSAITGITVGGENLDNTAYSVSEGKITFTPSASALLESSGRKLIVIKATGYLDATLSQTLGAGQAAKLVITTSPAAPTVNGTALATQPVVAIQDQYGNATISTAIVTAAVGAGSWTLGGTAAVAAVNGTTTFSGLTATSAGAVTGATISFSSGNMTGATSSGFNIPAPPPPGEILISQVYTAGGNSGATYNTDYVELYNPGVTDKDLTGWSIQYTSATGTGAWSVQTISSGTIKAGKYFLVSLASSGAVGVALPNPDFVGVSSGTGSVNLAISTGKVALANSSTPFSGATPTGAVDFVGYGTANSFEGAAAAPSPSATKAIFRAGKGATDSNNNGADFSLADPDPRYSSFGGTFDLSINPAAITEGDTATLTVTLSTPAPAGGLSIALTTNDTDNSEVQLSSPLTVLEGATTGSVTVNAKADGVFDADQTVVITGEALNWKSSGPVSVTVVNLDLTKITPIPLDGSNSNSYIQSFNGLGTRDVMGVFPASNGVQVSLGEITTNTVNGWYGAKIAGSGTAPANLLANAGTTNIGTIYSFGLINDTNRALGTIASSTNTMAFGALIRNDTVGTITNVKVSFTAEFWRNAIPTFSTSSAETNVLVFGYGKVDGTSNSVSNFLISSNALSQTNLNITGPAPVAYGTTPVDLDGNLATNQVVFSNVAVPLSLAAGEMAFVRWQDKDNTGYDAGIGMDNFTLSYEVDRTVTLSSFTPSAGPVNTQVTIRGVNFTAGIPVKFNGTAASLVSFISSTELAVTVPEGATTGYITVGEGAGAVASETAFVVGNFRGNPTLSGSDFGSPSLGSASTLKFRLDGGVLPGPTLEFLFDQPEFSISEDGSDFASTLSVPLDNGSVSYVFPILCFTPTVTGVKTAVLTVTSGGILIGKYAFRGTGTGLTQPTYFAGYGQNGRASLYWGADPSYDLVILGKEGSSVTDAPSASGSYTGNTSFGSGTSVGSSTTIFSGLDSSVSNTVVTGLRNNQFTYFKIFNRNPTAGVVSAGKEIRVMPYADITSGVITRWNFNNSDLNPSTGSGTAEAVEGVDETTGFVNLDSGFVNGVAGSSDRATVNKTVSVKGVTGKFTGMEFAVSTVGKKEVKVFWDIAASGSASKYTRFQYTLDVTATPPVWLDYNPALQDSPGVTPAGGLYVLDTADSTLLQRSADLSLVSGVENNAKFGFRVITAYAPGTSAIARADGTSAAYSTVGTVKYDMVTVTGTTFSLSPYVSWATAYGLTGADGLGDADPDGDGMKNNAEFAFGTSPVSGASRAVTQTSVAGGIKITWLQRSEVTYAVKSTVNLESAFSGPVSSSLVSPQPGGLGDYQQYEATLTGGDRGFIKVEATIP